MATVSTPVSQPKTMWISKYSRNFFVSATTVALALFAAGCGMAEGEDDHRDQTDYLTLSDPQFMAFCLEHYDLNGDGKFSRYEAERIIHLDCSSLGISTLDELDDFSRLEHLDCSDNAIERLDLSRCTLLKAVHCADNALTDLEIGDLRSLDVLNCRGNRLQHIDLSSCSSLRQADLRENRFSTLDCSLCHTALKADVRANPSLETVYYRAGQQINFESPTTLIERP